MHLNIHLLSLNVILYYLGGTWNPGSSGRNFVLRQCCHRACTRDFSPSVFPWRYGKRKSQRRARRGECSGEDGIWSFGRRCGRRCIIWCEAFAGGEWTPLVSPFVKPILLLLLPAGCRGRSPQMGCEREVITCLLRSKVRYGCSCELSYFFECMELKGFSVLRRDSAIDTFSCASSASRESRLPIA